MYKNSSAFRVAGKLFVPVVLLSCGLLLPFRAIAGEPLRALLITGGCCHDYEAQKKIITEGIRSRANVVWTTIHEGGDTREHEVSIYRRPDWAKGYDVVVHNECFGFVTNAAFVEGIARAHYEGVPAVVLHCSTHSYRNSTTDEWRKLLGVSSYRHQALRPFNVVKIQNDHPIMKGFPDDWQDFPDELYEIVKTWPNCLGLAKGLGEKQTEHVCIWVNTYGKSRVFGTTLGHSNDTMKSEVYLDLIGRGLLWVCDKLDENGQPKAGFSPLK